MNVSHIIETALLLLVAYLIGCIIGYTLRRLTARTIPVQGDAVQPAAVTPAPAPAQVRELSAAARLAMASPPEPAAERPTQPTVILQTAVVPAPVIEPTPPVSAIKAEPAASVAKPKPSVIKAAKPITVAPVPSKPKPVSKVPADSKAIERTAPATKPPTKSTKAVTKSKPTEAIPPAQAPTATPVAKPVAAKAPTKPTPKPAAKAPPKRPIDPKPAGLSAPRSGGADDLKLIKGIGPKIEQTLNSLGIFHFDQLAKFNKANVEWLDEHLGFKGRVTREDWLAQAKTLAKPKQ